MPAPIEVDDRAVDRAIIADLVLGEREAGEKFVRRHGGLIRSVIFGLGNLSHEEFEDLVQDCYGFLWERNFRVLKQWRAEAKLSTYLHQVVRRRALETLARMRRSNPVDLCQELDPNEPLSPATETYAKELRHCLEHALDRLRANYRQMIELAHGTDLSYRAIAERLDISCNNVAVTLHRAEKSLRKVFLEICPEHYSELFGHHAISSGMKV